MGTMHSYTCKECKNLIDASMTETEGMNSKILAVKCNDCKAVSDSVIETRTIDNEIIKSSPSCDECGSSNVIKWDGKCPKCNSEMIDNGAFMYWD